MFQEQMELHIAYVAGRNEINGWIHSDSSMASVVEGSIEMLNIIMMVAMAYQPLVHMVIAINRLTAFVFPLRHSTIWSRRAVIVSTAGMATIAVLFVVIPSSYIRVLFAVDPTAGHTPVGDMTWDYEAVSFREWQQRQVNAACCLVPLLVVLDKRTHRGQRQIRATVPERMNKWPNRLFFRDSSTRQKRMDVKT